jgi:hypothetical protein
MQINGENIENLLVMIDIVKKNSHNTQIQKTPFHSFSLKISSNLKLLSKTTWFVSLFVYFILVTPLS